MWLYKQGITLCVMQFNIDPSSKMSNFSKNKEFMPQTEKKVSSNFDFLITWDGKKACRRRLIDI